MIRRRMKRRVTEAQRQAARENGKHGGRPKAPSDRVKRIIEQARMLGAVQRLKNLRLLIDIRDDPFSPRELRVEVAERIEDRYGQPKQSVQIAANVEMEGAKLVEFIGFPAPEGFDGAPLDVPVLPPDLRVVGGNGNGDAPRRLQAGDDAP